MRATFVSGLFALAMVVAGCQVLDSPLDVGQSNAGGTGTATLLVVGEVAGADVAGGTFDTNFHVTVADAAGTPVSGAIVVIQGPFGTITLTENPTIAGEYTGFRNGYSVGMYVLGVSAGPDAVLGVNVTAPVVHTITTPTTNDILRQNLPFNVLWSRASAAQQSQTETLDFISEWMLIDKEFSEIPAFGNPPRTDQRLRLRRRNVQLADGGLAGSEFRAQLRTTVEPLVSQ